MNAPHPESTMSISELFGALDAKITQQISLSRSTPPGQNPSSSRVVEELDSGVKRLLLRLKELRNSRRPIQRLPPDVVVAVATYLSPRACDGDFRPILAMSQVCRYWRETLLLDTTCWSFIGSEFVGLLPLFIERSGSRLLEINLAMDSLFSFLDTIQHIGRHAGRLGILRCDLEEGHPISLQALSQLNYAPHLRTFSLTINRPPAVAPVATEIPLFLGEMPTLHRLDLLPFPITPQLAECKHLVDLRLDVRYSTLTSVLDLLSANPSLEKVGLLGNFEDPEDARAAETISMKHLRFLTVERCIPCLFLEKFVLPGKARVFVRYNFIPHLAPSAYTLPLSKGGYPNLEGLSSLYTLMTNDTYIDVTGPNGSIAIQYSDLQDGSTLSETLDALPTTRVTRLTCESHPTFTGMKIGEVVNMMDRLPQLEEITLVHFGGADVQNFLSALVNTNEWTNLRTLGFTHCRQIEDWIRYLINVAAERDGGLKLDTITIIFEEGKGDELFSVLEGFVGTLELVEEKAGQVLRSVQEWDDDNCTTRRVSVSVWAD